MSPSVAKRHDYYLDRAKTRIISKLQSVLTDVNLNLGLGVWLFIVVVSIVVGAAVIVVLQIETVNNVTIIVVKIARI